jgi:hypothetical protein
LLKAAAELLPTFSAAPKTCQAQNYENPRQSSTFAWRMSYAPTAILESGIEKALATCRGFSFIARRKRITRYITNI